MHILQSLMVYYYVSEHGIHQGAGGVVETREHAKQGMREVSHLVIVRSVMHKRNISLPPSYSAPL